MSASEKSFCIVRPFTCIGNAFQNLDSLRGEKHWDKLWFRIRCDHYSLAHGARPLGARVCMASESVPTVKEILSQVDSMQGAVGVIAKFDYKTVYSFTANVKFQAL